MLACSRPAPRPPGRRRPAPGRHARRASMVSAVGQAALAGQARVPEDERAGRTRSPAMGQLPSTASPDQRERRAGPAARPVSTDRRLARRRLSASGRPAASWSPRSGCRRCTDGSAPGCSVVRCRRPARPRPPGSTSVAARPARSAAFSAVGQLALLLANRWARPGLAGPREHRAAPCRRADQPRRPSGARWSRRAADLRGAPPPAPTPATSGRPLLRTSSDGLR